MADIRNLDANLSVAAQIQALDIASIQAAGFKAIICNRPDGEEPNQPEHAAIQSAALAAGLEYHFLPITPGQMTADQVAQFAVILDSSPKPMLAYCRTGTRCTMLWALSQAGKHPAASLIETASKAGYDLSALAARLP